MSEGTGIPLPPPAVEQKKTNPWIIAIVVLVVICCGCFGVLGLIFGFWDPIQQTLGLSSSLPGLTVLL
jgi:hypothetical protein